LQQDHQPGRSRLISHHQAQTRAMVVVPLVKMVKEEADALSPTRSDQSRFEEACGLARAIDLDIVASSIFSVNQPRPATLLTTGKVEELKTHIAQSSIDLVIIDHTLTPVQQRNLEKIWGTKVIDRTGLILEIFGARARTKEGVIQVELAHLNYQKGRLVRSWTHLERQRGGTGFLGGPGETQIEADRRSLQNKINQLRQELDKIVRTRKLHRSKRQKIPWPVVALVGYTNAGKSTLFNALTGADVQAQNMLFATLDPTLRRLTLPHGGAAILSDTVGFISNLPTHLVAAFRATLEEVVEADLILHVRDIADPDTTAQAQDVMAILETLGIENSYGQRMIEVWNKSDLLEEAEKTQCHLRAAITDVPVCLVSAITGEGLDALSLTIEQHILGEQKQRHIRLEAHEMALVDWLYRHAGVKDKNAHKIERHDLDDGGIELVLDLNEEDWQRFLAMKKNVTQSRQTL